MMEPATRSEAYMLMSRLSQDLCNEVEYTEKLKNTNKSLAKDIERLNARIEELTLKLEETNKAKQEWVNKYYNATGGTPEDFNF